MNTNCNECFKPGIKLKDLVPGVFLKICMLHLVMCSYLMGRARKVGTRAELGTPLFIFLDPPLDSE